MTPQTEALKLLESALEQLESAKGSVLASVQKLLRASNLLGHEDISIWCQVQLGEPKYTGPLKKLLDAASAKGKDPRPKEEQAKVEAILKDVSALGLKPMHYTLEELNVKVAESGGGYISIGFIEERYADLVRTKRGNDGTYYKNNLYNHLNYVRKRAHELASTLYNQLKFAGTVGSCFDVLKEAVDDRLIDMDPALGEQLMLAFKGVASSSGEEWSQALTTCRRLLEGLADRLYPATKDAEKGRSLGQSQYVNRLWAFMDRAIESETNRELAKTHVDFLGAWLEKANKISHKGVHAEVDRLEAVKAVFHTYLVVADILDYLDKKPGAPKKPAIGEASIDELEALLGVSRNIAKEIFKTRVRDGKLSRASLATVKGVGPKTLERAASVFELPA
jgi:DNA uptake protein ComE-like DNA-binding protein